MLQCEGNMYQANFKKKKRNDVAIFHLYNVGKQSSPIWRIWVCVSKKMALSHSRPIGDSPFMTLYPFMQKG